VVPVAAVLVVRNNEECAVPLQQQSTLAVRSLHRTRKAHSTLLTARACQISTLGPLRRAW
jgi:hypothetical protein